MYAIKTCNFAGKISSVCVLVPASSGAGWNCFSSAAVGGGAIFRGSPTSNHRNKCVVTTNNIANIN